MVSGEPLPPEVYARVFGQGEGALVLAELDRVYCTRLYVEGGEDGRRRTDFNLGSFAVVEWCKTRRDAATSPNADHNEQDPPPAG